MKKILLVLAVIVILALFIFGAFEIYRLAGEKIPECKGFALGCYILFWCVLLVIWKISKGEEE